MKAKVVLEKAKLDWEKMDADSKAPYEEKAAASLKEANDFREFALKVKEVSLRDGVEDDMKALRADAAKRWFEHKNQEKKIMCWSILREKL